MGEEEPKVEDQIMEAVEEPPPYFIWVLGYLVSVLVAGAFFVTGLWLSMLMNWKENLWGGVFMGLIPGLASGGVMTGLVYSVHPKWTGKALGVSLFGIALPLVAIPFVMGYASIFAVMLAPMATVLAGLASPKIINEYRKRGLGKVKAPKGSWEDNF